MANIIGLFRGLRHFGPALGALTLQPEAVQGFDRRGAARPLVRQEAAHDQARTADTGTAVNINPPAAVERKLNIGEHLRIWAMFSGTRVSAMAERK